MPRLLWNPHAGRRGTRHLCEKLRARSDVELILPSDARALELEARRAAEEGQDRLLVAGGDGTLHHAIRGLAGSDCALGIVPLGSGNDLARALGVPLDPEHALARALVARPRRIDLGLVDGRPFAGVAGIGFDSEVARFARERVRAARGRWIYPYAVMRTVLSFHPPTLTVSTDSGTFRGPVMLAALANSPCYGGGMRIAPDAALDDGRLDLIVVEPVARLRLLALFPRVYRGTHVGLPEVRHWRVSGATVDVDPPSTIFADGEPLGPCTRARVEVRPGALTVAA